MKNIYLKNLFLLSLVTFLSVSFSFAHTVKPTGVRVSKEESNRVCSKQNIVSERRKTLVRKMESQKDDRKKIEDALNNFSNTLTPEKKKIVSDELTNVGVMYDNIYDKQFEIVRNMAEIEEQMCGGDIGYVRQQTKVVNEDMDKLNQQVRDLKKYLKHDLKEKIQNI